MSLPEDRPTRRETSSPHAPPGHRQPRTPRPLRRSRSLPHSTFLDPLRLQRRTGQNERERPYRQATRPVNARKLMLSVRTVAAARKRELKNGSPRGVRRRPKPTTMNRDDRTADRQPHAHPVGFGRVERLEHPVEIPFFQPPA